MITDIWHWASEANPNGLTPGWYPTLTCFDPEEGAIPGAHHWDGSRFVGSTASRVSAWIPERHDDEQGAVDCAYRHDPGL